MVGSNVDFTLGAAFTDQEETVVESLGDYDKIIVEEEEWRPVGFGVRRNQ